MLPKNISSRQVKSKNVLGPKYSIVNAVFPILNMTLYTNPLDSLNKWDRFVDFSPQGSIFCRSWWLRSVCPNNFTILSLRKAGRIVAGIPLPTFINKGLKYIKMPLFCQTLGILMEPPASQKYETRLSQEMELIDNIIKAMPKYDHFDMNFNYNFTNWFKSIFSLYKGLFHGLLHMDYQLLYNYQEYRGSLRCQHL